MTDGFADECPFSDQEFEAFLDSVNCVLDTNSAHAAPACPENRVRLTTPKSATLHATSSQEVLVDPDLCHIADGRLSHNSLLDGTIFDLHCGSSLCTDVTPAATAQHDSQQAHGQSPPVSQDPCAQQTASASAAATQSGAHKPAKKSTETSRAAQRRYRERQKAQVQQLQAELRKSKATVARLQSENHFAKCQTLVTPVQPQVSRWTPQIQSIAWQGPDLPDATTISVLRAPWTSWGAIVACDLLPHEAEACQHVANLTLPELAAIRQEHVRRVSKLLLTTGPDTDCPAGRHLRQVVHEYCCLHAVKTRVSPRGWSHFYSFEGAQNEVLEGMPISASQRDMPTLLRMLQLTEEQKAALCAARRQYLSSVMCIARQRKLLLQQLQDIPAVGLDGSQFVATSDTEEDLLRKLHACTLDANADYVHLQGITGHQVLTLWQACVCICHFYPQSPDVLAIVNAAASEAGEFSVHASTSIDTASPDTGVLHHTAAAACQKPHTFMSRDHAITEYAPHEIESQDIFG